MLFGEICASWRPDIRDYREGVTVFVGCAYVLFGFEATIYKVQRTSLKDLTQEYLDKIGFSSRDDLLEYLRQFYSDISLESYGTFIEWADPRGFLVDNKEKYRDNPAKLYKSMSPYGENEGCD
jgi:hypothetical protein